MKKIVALVIMTAMLLSLAACGMPRTESSEDHGNEVSGNSESLSSVQTSEDEKVQVTQEKPIDVHRVAPIKLKEGEFIKEPRYYYDEDGTFSVTKCNYWYPILRERDKEIVSTYNLKFNLCCPDYRVEMGEEYLRIFYDGGWTGQDVEYCGSTISMLSGEVYVDDEPTGAKTDERIFVDKVVSLYQNGEWNGDPITVDFHEVCVNEECGNLLIDGYSSCIHDMSVDLMGTNLEREYLTRWCHSLEYNYIKGQGTYFIQDGRLVKYYRGEKTVLPGERLNIDLKDNQKISGPLYDKEEGKLHIFVIEESDTFDEPTIVYNYVFPDYNVSEVEYVETYEMNGDI